MALHLQGRDVELAQLDPQPLPRATPFAHSRTSLSAHASQKRFSSTQEHRVVDDSTRLVGDQYIPAFADAALGKIARRQELGKFRAVRAGDLDVTLDRHVP